MDCHAGRGRHKTGDPGSPLVAIKTFLDHNAKEEILSNSEIRFLFFEKNQGCCELLEKEIEDMRPFPEDMYYKVINSDYRSELRQLIDSLEAEGKQLAPSFFFLDPFGFKLPASLLQEILSHNRTELLVTFMVRFVDMALMSEEAGQEKNMDKLFGTDRWKDLRSIEEVKERRQAMLELYFEELGGDFKSVLVMQNKQQTAKYYLLHITNHPKGRRRMKKAMWDVSEGEYQISEADNLNQLTLIEPEPNLTALRESLLRDFRGEQAPNEELEEWILSKRWRRKHLRQVLRELRNEGVVEAMDYGSRFAFNRDPLFKFPD